MRIRVAFFRTVLLFCVVVHSASAFESDKSPKKKGEMLSVEETIKRAKDGVACGFLINHIQGNFNSQARPELHRLLIDPKQKDYWANMGMFFALVGQEEDVDLLMNRIKSFKDQSVSVHEGEVIASIIAGIANMSDRGIPNATEAMDKVIKLDFWKELNVQTRDRSSLVRFGTSEAFFALRSIIYKSRTRDPLFKKKVNAEWDRIKDPKLRKIYAKEIMGAFNENEIHLNAHKSGNYHKYMRERWLGPKKDIKTKNNKPKRKSKRDYMKSLKPDGRRLIKTNKNTETKMIREALKSFEHVSDAIIAGNYSYVVTRLADDGRPLLLSDEITADNIKDMLEDKNLVAALEGLKPVLQDVKKYKILRENYYVNYFNFPENRKQEIPEEVTDTPEKYADLILAQIAIDDEKAVREKHPKHLKGSGSDIPIIDPKDHLLINMVWEDDQWYWIPFGW